MVPEETLERAAVDDVSPRYLRRQKPVDVKRSRTRSQAGRLRRAARWLVLTVGACALSGLAIDLFFFSPAVLLRPAGIQISGEQFVSRDQLLNVFSADLGRSVLRVPLEHRLRAIESIPWVREATLVRALPNRLVLHVVERQPVAFLSTSAGLEVIDDQGVILDRPAGSNFNLPVVNGIGPQTPVEERASRVALFAEFLKEIAAVQSGAGAQVSEANLASPDDVEATLAGGPALAGQGPVLVHFGNANFAERYRELLENFGAWQVRAGTVEAVDLRYNGQALVTPGDPLAAPGPGAADAAPSATAGPAQVPLPQAAKAGAPANAAGRKSSVAIPTINAKGSERR